MTELDQALAHHQAGRLEEAEALYREILAQQPDHADALHLLGVMALQSGQPKEAVALIERAIDIDGQVADYHNNLGEALRAQDKLEAAMRAYEKALALRPDFAAAYNNLGNTLEIQGQLTEAIEAYQGALALQPDPETQGNLAHALKAQGRLSEAVAAYEQAIALNPDFVEAYSGLGATLREQGQIDKAIATFGEAIARKFDYVEGYYNLASTLYERGQLAEAISVIRQALVLQPRFAEAYNVLGLALRAQGKLGEAIEVYREALNLKSDFSEAHSNLGVALQRLGKLDEAIAAYEEALALQPNNTGTLLNLGTAYQEQVRLDDATETYRRALALAPDPDTHSNLLTCLNYRTDIDASTMFIEHHRWGTANAGSLLRMLRSHSNDLDPERRLRVGYVSPDFRGHSVAYFAEPLLAAHDRARFEVFCYSNVSHPDAMTERLQSIADRWRNIVGLTDEMTADQIREDGVDILVDLAGHSADNRLLVFARKPAPIQVAYLGYPNTRGLTTIDYWLTDTYADPPGESDNHYFEKAMRLPCGFNCYQPLAGAPSVGLPPALSASHVTFGSFNYAPKVNPEVITVWSRVLRAVPDAQLILKARQFTDPGIRRRFQELFKKNRVSTQRVEMLGRIPSNRDHMSLYNRIDIALDTFPYNGHTTTCEALWMGVPVIVLAGNAHAGRVGVSLLSHVGLTEFIAENTDAYVATAVALANNVENLAMLRKNLRHRMQQSPLTNATHFARSVETVYRQMWRKWCKSQ